MRRPEQAGRAEAVLLQPLLVLSRPPHGTRSVPEARRLSCGRGCSDLDDGGAPSSSLAHRMSGPLGSRCMTATHAARSAIQYGCKSYRSCRDARAPRSVPTIARCFGRMGGAVCRRRRPWMRIGTACATGGRGGSADSGLAGGRACRESSMRSGLNATTAVHRFLTATRRMDASLGSGGGKYCSSARRDACHDRDT